MLGKKLSIRIKNSPTKNLGFHCAERSGIHGKESRWKHSGSTTTMFCRTRSFPAGLGESKELTAPFLSTAAPTTPVLQKRVKILPAVPHRLHRFRQANRHHNNVPQIDIGKNKITATTFTYTLVRPKHGDTVICNLPLGGSPAMLTYEKGREERAQQGAQGQLQHHGAHVSRQTQGEHDEGRSDDQGDRSRKHLPEKSKRVNNGDGHDGW